MPHGQLQMAVENCKLKYYYNAIRVVFHQTDMHYIINTVQGKLQLTLNNSRRFLFCQETSQLTSTRLLSFVTGRGESKSCSRENVLL